MAVNKTIQMVNVSDEKITITLGASPGDGVTEYELEPGQSAPFHENLCKPVPGAGTTAMPAILARKSMRTFPDGVRRPALVPAADAKRVRADYQKAIETWKKSGSPVPKIAPLPDQPAR